MALFVRVQHLYSFNIAAPLINHLFLNVWKVSRRTPSFLLMFRIDCPIARISSSLVLYRVPRSGFFTLAKRLFSQEIISGEYGGCSRIIFHCLRRKRSMTAIAVWLLALSWRMVEFCITKCRHMLHAVLANILAYYWIVPLQFWSEKVALFM